MKPLYEVAVGFGENLRRCQVARSDTLVKLAGSLGVPYEELLDGLLWTPSIRTAA